MDDFLDSLESDSNYLVNIDFIPNINEYAEDNPQMTLSVPILVNRLSSSIIVSNHIINKFDIMENIFYFNNNSNIDFLCNPINNLENHKVILLTYSEIFI
jgi:hypothetical protein